LKNGPTGAIPSTPPIRFRLLARFWYRDVEKKVTSRGQIANEIG
jgi:hypothetical protein